MVRGNSVNAAANGGVNGRAVIPPLLDPSQQPGNVYYVHPSSVTVTPVLNNSNYHSWARSMRRALGGKEQIQFYGWINSSSYGI